MKTVCSRQSPKVRRHSGVMENTEPDIPIGSLIGSRKNDEEMLERGADDYLERFALTM